VSGLDDYLNSNPNRQRVLDFLKETSWYTGDLSLVRKVAIAVGDELQEMRANYAGAIAERGEGAVEQRLIDGWRSDLSSMRDTSKVAQGELGGLPPEVLRIVRGIFPSVSQYSEPTGAAPAAYAGAQATGAGVPASAPTPAASGDYAIPQPKRGGAGKKAAALALVALVCVAGAAFVLEPDLLAGLLNAGTPQGPDTAPPTITGLYPSNGSTSTGLSGVSVSYYDDRGVNLSTVRMRIDGSWVALTTLTVTSAGCAPPPSYGTHIAYVYLQDTSGNSAEASWTFTTSSLLQSTVDAMLEQLNAERRAVGLAEVQLVGPIASSYRTEDMAANGYFNHYDLSGYLPTYYYTLLGGQYAMEENIGYLRASSLVPGKIPNYSASLVSDMVHDDAGSAWGHRDSLLDPTNNLVDISASWTDSRLFVALHMIKSWVDWAKPPTLEGGTFSCSGNLTMSGSTLDSVYIYRSVPSEHDDMTYSDTLDILRGEGSYGVGDLIAGVIPYPYYYEGIGEIRPSEWSIDGTSFSIAFKFDATEGPAIYTVMIYATNTLGVAHPYDPERYADIVPVMEYSILVE
jgi:uncharacterized protein YkwD